jgi:hypothetical protein
MMVVEERKRLRSAKGTSPFTAGALGSRIKMAPRHQGIEPPIDGRGLALAHYDE